VWHNRPHQQLPWAVLPGDALQLQQPNTEPARQRRPATQQKRFSQVTAVWLPDFRCSLVLLLLQLLAGCRCGTPHTPDS
jgi:hypothetical protein